MRSDKKHKTLKNQKNYILLQKTIILMVFLMVFLMALLYNEDKG